MLTPARSNNTEGDSQRFDAIHSATESAYFGSLTRCQSGFGNVGIVFAAVVVVELAAVAVFAAAAGCIPQCFAAVH